MPADVNTGRRWLPDLTKRTGRLRYIGQMYWAAEVCIYHGDASFSKVDLSELESLWIANTKGMSPEAIYQVRYDNMHHHAGGGTPISNASCSDARAWLTLDSQHLHPPTATPTGDAGQLTRRLR